MEVKLSWIIIAVLFVVTAIYSLTTFFPTLMVHTVNTDNLTIVEIPEKENINIVVDPIKEEWQLEEDGTVLLSFNLDNREYPSRWKEKEIFLKTTYTGIYDENTLTELDEYLETEYNWRNQLDTEGNIVLGGPLLLKDGVYQLHVHNGLSYTQKQYLFGDLLHWLYSYGNLEDTEMTVGNITLKCIWTKDTNILEDNVAPIGGDLIISTCLERNGDRRLLSGWIVME